MIERGFDLDGVPLWHIQGSRYSVLQQNLSYTDEAGRTHTARAGMITDGMTNPRITWRVGGAPYANGILLECILHDHYCWQAASLPVGSERNALRLSGDRLFREMIVFDTGNDIKAEAYYRFVRMGAWSTRYREPCPSYIHEPKAFANWLNVDPDAVMQYHGLGKFMAS